MKGLKSWLTAAASAAAVFTLSHTSVQACEVDRPVIIAGLNWDSNAFHAALASRILKSGFGCQVEVAAGATRPLFKSMMRGDVDIMMEVWKDNLPKLWPRAQRDGEVIELGVNYPDAVQGWFIPRYLVEGDGAPAPDLKSVTDLPAYKALFADPENRAKGRFYNCMLGWGCESINSRKLKAYDLLDHYTNFRPVSGEALIKAISTKYKRKQPFLTYYWGPTWVLGTYDLIMLEEPPYDPTVWKTMAADSSPTAATAYPVSSISIGVSKVFHAAAPEIGGFLAAYRTSSAMISDALAYINQTGEDADSAARYFLKNRPEVWKKWVPAERAAKVEAALN